MKLKLFYLKKTLKKYKVRLVHDVLLRRVIEINRIST